MARKAHPDTPDGRYFVAKSRLWRKTNPGLDETARRAEVKRLMQARRAVGQAQTPEAETEARAAVDAAKRALGERGPVWWQDGAPDEGGKHPQNSSYADWWQTLPPEARAAGES
ncbi:hypothetical protein [Roseivivax sp.]